MNLIKSTSKWYILVFTHDIDTCIFTLNMKCTCISNQQDRLQFYRSHLKSNWQSIYVYQARSKYLIENSQHTIKSAFIDNEHKCHIGLENTGSLIFTWKQTFLELCTQSIFWSLSTQSWLFPKSRSLCFRKIDRLWRIPSQPFYITYYMASAYMYVRTLSKQSANNMKYIGDIHWFDEEYCSYLTNGTELFFIFTSFPRENVIKVKW